MLYPHIIYIYTHHSLIVEISSISYISSYHFINPQGVFEAQSYAERRRSCCTNDRNGQPQDAQRFSCSLQQCRDGSIGYSSSIWVKHKKFTNLNCAIWGWFPYKKPWFQWGRTSEVVIIYTEISNILEGWIQYLGVAYPLFSMWNTSPYLLQICLLQMYRWWLIQFPLFVKRGAWAWLPLRFHSLRPTGFDGQSPLCIPTGMHMHAAIKSPHTLAIHVQVLCGLQRVVSSRPCTLYYAIYSCSRSELLIFEACFQSYSAGNLPSCLSANFGSSVL